MSSAGVEYATEDPNAEEKDDDDQGGMSTIDPDPDHDGMSSRHDDYASGYSAMGDGDGYGDDSMYAGDDYYDDGGYQEEV